MLLHDNLIYEDSIANIDVPFGRDDNGIPNNEDDSGVELLGYSNHPSASGVVLFDRLSSVGILIFPQRSRFPSFKVWGASILAVNRLTRPESQLPKSSSPAKLGCLVLR